MIHSRPFKIHLLARSLIYMNPKVKILNSHWSIISLWSLGCYLDQSDGEDPDDVPELRSFHKLQDAGLVRMRTRQIEARIRRKKSRRKKVSHHLHCNTLIQSVNTPPVSKVRRVSKRYKKTRGKSRWRHRQFRISLRSVINFWDIFEKLFWNILDKKIFTKKFASRGYRTRVCVAPGYFANSDTKMPTVKTYPISW